MEHRQFGRRQAEDIADIAPPARGFKIPVQQRVGIKKAYFG